MSKVSFILLICLSLYFSVGFKANYEVAQIHPTDSELTEEQYELINLTYHQERNDKLKLYHQSIGDPSWVDRLLEYKSEDYLFLYKFKNAELPLALEKLSELRSELSVKSWDSKNLAPRTRLRKKRDDEVTIYMAEPLIHADYAFVLIRKPKAESVYIYFRDPELGWTEECVIPLAFVIECYG